MEAVISRLEKELESLSSEPNVGRKSEVTNELVKYLNHGKLIMSVIACYLDKYKIRDNIKKTYKSMVLFAVLSILSIMVYYFYNLLVGVFALGLSYILTSAYYCWDDIVPLAKIPARIEMYNLYNIYFDAAVGYLSNNQYAKYKEIFNNYGVIYSKLAKFDDKSITLDAIVSCLPSIPKDWYISKDWYRHKKSFGQTILFK
jgi:hypothetical protein